MLFLPCLIGAEPLYFRSNSLGLLLDPVPGIEQKGHIAVVETEIDREHVSLLLDGREIKRWERLLDGQGNVVEEKEFSENELIAKRSFTTEGLLSEETLPGEEGGIRSYFYHYRDRRLSLVQVLDERRQPIYSEHYGYTPEGMLREVVREGSEEGSRLISWRYHNGSLVEERIADQGILIISRYDPEGRLVRWEHWKDQGQIEQKIWEYDGRQRFPRYVLELNYDTGSRVEKIYNTAGRLTEKRHEGDETERWELTYDREGELARELYYRNDVLVKSMIYSDRESWYEEFYRQSEPFLRIYYSRGEKVKEEFIRDGQVVRSRSEESP
jgi:YD repeat-containing protein